MPESYETTRHSLHGLAELVLAGPRHAAGGSMRLRVDADGIRTWDEPAVRLRGGDLESGATRVRVDGLTYAAAARRIGLVARPMDDVYRDGPHVTPDERVVLDLTEVLVVERALALGNDALRSFAPSAEPVLWPEHFDVAITVDAVNYGVSPGDGYLDRPYAYVGPHEQRSGSFWNAPFGAAFPLEDATDVATVAAFFARGAQTAAG